ncbi:hypothetical protein ACS5PJ_14415 [Pseudarthrobacter sp. YS3]|uniref:hypothetical protein n=1 Tax=Pseudarthrobacter sp. YS3 TaxID=3453718 RepID=UPI003EE8581E
MGSLDLGALATVRWPTAPDTGAYALAVKRPDGTTLTPAPAVTGFKETVQAKFTPSMAGRYLLSWTAGGAGAHTDVLDVWPADPQFLISVDEVLAGLRLPANADPAKAQDLRLYVAAATPVIEDITGPMLATTKTFTTWGGGSAVVLPHLPNQILGITADGAPVTSYVPELAAGIIYAGSRTAASSFPGGELVITYRVGAAEIPPNIRLAARELVRFWWQGGMQGSGGNARGSASDGDAFTPSGYAVPRRVIELCAAHEQAGGFA